MPVMWDRLKTTNAAPVGLLDHQFHHHHLNQPGAGAVVDEQQREKAYWNDSFEQRLNALGVADKPFRYEIRRGKTVALRETRSIRRNSDSSVYSDDTATPDRQHQHQHHPSLSKPRQLDDVDGRGQAPTTKEKTGLFAVLRQASTSGNRKKNPLARRGGGGGGSAATASDNMYGYGYNYSYGQAAVEQISPPSSPEWNATQSGFMPDDVSPIDDDDDLLSQQQFLRSAQPTPPSPQPVTSQSDQQPRGGNSSIPMLRRDRRKHQDAAAAALREAKTKEKKDKQKHPVKSSTSRNGGARLDQSGGDLATGDWSGAGHHHEPSAHPSSYGVTTTITGPQPSRPGDAIHAFGQRVRQQLAKGKPQPVESRPPWQGASGRSALLPAVRDNVNAPPLVMPVRGGGRPSGGRNADVSLAGSVSPVASPLDRNPETPGSSSTAANLRRLLPSIPISTPTTPSPKPTAAAGQGAAMDRDHQSHRAGRPDVQSSYPEPPFTTESFPPAYLPQLSSSQPQPQPPPPMHSFAPPPTTRSPEPQSLLDQSKAIRRKPQLAPVHLPKLSTSSSTYSDQPEPVELVNPASYSGSNVPNATDTAEPWRQPPSRFSVTTYATSSVAEDDSSPVPPPPSVPMPIQTSQPVSIMDRRRPTPAEPVKANSADPILISIKSAYPPTTGPSARTASEGAKANANPGNTSTRQSPTFKDVDMTQSPDIMVSTSKALPPAPPELSAASDRVAHLSARLESLALRRVNLTKSIKQMTELMPSDTLMASAEVIRRREIEKQKVETLREELAEVQREEHDLGLKLHLAYKRLEREADYETTGLWVKRVTG